MSAARGASGGLRAGGGSVRGSGPRSGSKRVGPGQGRRTDLRAVGPEEEPRSDAMGGGGFAARRGPAGPGVEARGRAEPRQGESAGLGRCGIEGGGRRSVRAEWSVLMGASPRERAYPRDGGWGEKFQSQWSCPKSFLLLVSITADEQRQAVITFDRDKKKGARTSVPHL